MKRIAEAISRMIHAAKRMLTRAGAKSVGRYAALALLLAMLGLASHAYRQRLAAGEAQPVPQAVAAVRVPEATPEPTPEPALWVWPLEGEVVGAYSPDAPVWSQTLSQWQTHPGIDIAGAAGEAVYACRDGQVVDAWSDALWGNVIVIEHGDGYRSTYAGLNTLKLVSPGDAVEMGQVISAVGNTASREAELGYHIHFELAKDGSPVDFDSVIADK